MANKVKKAQIPKAINIAGDKNEDDDD